MNKKTKRIFIALALILLTSISTLAILIPKSIESKTGIKEESTTEINAETCSKGNNASSNEACDESLTPNKKTQSKQSDDSSPTTSLKKKKDTKGNPRKLEMPATRKGEIIISHMAYTLSFNNQHNNPNWVAWELTANEVAGTGRRADEFMPDPLVDIRHQVTTKDYTGSGYDRGHMCPAADNKWNPQAMTECFYMTNMCPQLHELNAGSWESLENACRRWATQEGGIYIVCGPLYDTARKVKTIGKEHLVSVPTGFFKCVLSTLKGREKAIGFIFANSTSKQKMNELAVTVDKVEQLTGYDFFVNLDKDIEKRVEAECNLKAWR